MSSVFKTQSKHSKGKGRAQAPAEEDEIMLENGIESDEGEGVVTSSRKNEEDGEKKDKRRKDKVLMLSSRGVTQRMRHLMHDVEVLLPHIKKGEWSPAFSYVLASQVNWEVNRHTHIELDKKRLEKGSA